MADFVTQSPKDPRACKQCGTLFVPKSTRIPGVFCGRPCAVANLASDGIDRPTKPRIGRYIPCTECSRAIYRRPSASKCLNTFCDRKCRNIWRNKNVPRGEAAHNWKGGKKAAIQRRYADPPQRMFRSVTVQMGQALRGDKGGRHWECLVNYTAMDLRMHIERQFHGRMKWANYGRWHLEHIIPRASFKFTTGGLDDAEWMACWALSNLRPMWKRANIRKGSKRLTLL